MGFPKCAFLVKINVGVVGFNLAFDDSKSLSFQWQAAVGC